MSARPTVHDCVDDSGSKNTIQAWKHPTRVDSPSCVVKCAQDCGKLLSDGFVGLWDGQKRG